MVPRDDAEVYDVSEIYLPVTEKISKSSYCTSEKRYLLKFSEVRTERLVHDRRN